MSDILLLAGVALCLLSVLAAIYSLARTEAPRGAAISLVLGIALLIGGAWLDDRPFGIEAIRESGQRLVDGDIALGTDPVTAPDPAPEAETAPEAEAGGEPAAEAETGAETETETGTETGTEVEADAEAEAPASQ